MWRKFSKRRPRKAGWYQCTVEVKNQQRYVMDLYWYPYLQRFKDNRRQSIFDEYTVIDCDGNQMTAFNLCDRTDSVIAWRKMPKPYMRGFVKKEVTLCE